MGLSDLNHAKQWKEKYESLSFAWFEVKGLIDLNHAKTVEREITSL